MDLATFQQIDGTAGGWLGPIPTRAQVCTVQNSFQGLMVNASGPMNFWWDPYFLSADAATRQAAYAAKRAAGDTHVLLTLDLRGLDCLPSLYNLTYEALTTGGMKAAAIFCMGDGNGKPDEPNYDPGALGWYWLMDNFAAIVEYFQTGPHGDLTPYIIFFPGFDGVVPGWQPFTRVNQFAQMARGVLGSHRYLGLEQSAGYWCWSGEQDDWATDDGKCFDTIFQEFAPYGRAPRSPVPDDFCNQPDDIRAPFDQDWQVSKRLLGPTFIRPTGASGMPDCDDPGLYHGGPMATTTPRGDYFVNAGEFDTYPFVRQHELSTEIVMEDAQYYYAMGYKTVCAPLR